jgi:hypothetical protein
MKNSPLTCAAVAVASVVLLFPGILCAQSVLDESQDGAYLLLAEAMFSLQSDDKDLNACQQDCRSRFGVDMYANPQWRGGSGTDGAYYAYANCIASCNRRFWKAFDNEMDELEKDK